MDTKKLNYLLIAATAMLAIALFGSGMIANRILTNKSVQLSKLKAESQVTSDLQDVIKKDKADIAKYSDLNTIAQSVVPQDKDQAQTVSEIVKIANESKIAKLSSITFPASTLGSPGSSSITQVTAVTGIPGVYLLPITITQDTSSAIPYSQFITFLQKLENNRRTSQVTAINIQPDSKTPQNISFTLTVNEYIKP
jgi:hypothetical protein